MSLRALLDLAKIGKEKVKIQMDNAYATECITQIKYHICTAMQSRRLLFTIRVKRAYIITQLRAIRKVTCPNR